MNSESSKRKTDGGHPRASVTHSRHSKHDVNRATDTTSSRSVAVADADAGAGRRRWRRLAVTPLTAVAVDEDVEDEDVDADEDERFVVVFVVAVSVLRGRRLRTSEDGGGEESCDVCSTDCASAGVVVLCMVPSMFVCSACVRAFMSVGLSIKVKRLKS